MKIFLKKTFDLLSQKIFVLSALFFLLVPVVYALDDFEAFDEEGTGADSFTLDVNNLGGDISLQFGATLAETLSWVDASLRFEISDDLLVDGLIDQNGNIFTLDSDNSGTGVDTDIVANQGSENDGTLRYSTSRNGWEYSNDSTEFIPLSPYGTEFNLFESTGVSTTTSTTYQTKITGTTTSLPVGKYKIAISYNWNSDIASNDFRSRISFDGTNLDAANANEMHRQEVKDVAGSFGSTGTNQKHGFSRVYFVDVVSAGTKAVLLEWSTASNGNEASIWNASVEIIRVE